MDIYTVNLAGQWYCQKEIKKCQVGEKVILKRDTENRWYDKKAVPVTRQNGEQIGYIARSNAEWVARIIDKGHQIDARIVRITGGTKGKPTLLGIQLYLDLN
jgi:hypothetical protein